MKLRILMGLFVLVVAVSALFWSEYHTSASQVIPGAWYQHDIHAVNLFFSDGTFLSTYLIPPTAWQSVKEWHLKGQWKEIGNNKIEIRFPFLMGDDSYRERTEVMWMREPGVLVDEENRPYERVENIDPHSRL